MSKEPVVTKIAMAFVALRRCEQTGNEWQHHWRIIIEDLCRNQLPSGSGVDSGTTFDFDASKPNRLVFNADYHHMSDGYYDGWTEHQIIVTPSLVFGFEIRVTGTNRNDIKDYLAELYQEALSQQIGTEE